MNISQLAYWKATGYSAADIDAVCGEIDQQMMAMRLSFSGDGNVHAAVTRRTWDRQEGHYPALMKFAWDLVNSYGLDKAKGSIIILLEDGMFHCWPDLSLRAPIFAFGRKREDAFTFLMPDPAFLESKGYAKDRLEISEREKGISWENKKPVVFWRGAASGVEGGDWRTCARARMALLANEWRDPRLDVLLTRIKHLGPDMAKELVDAGIVTEPCKFTDFLDYRYQVDVDGCCCAWISFFLKLCTNSPVLKVQSTHGYEQWYYDRLVPWVHYVPVDNALSRLKDLLGWLENHDAACRTIAANANAVMRTVTYESEAVAMAGLIQEVLACQRG